MKPYCKTFRASKDHKAERCSICSEDTAGGANYARKKGKADVDEGISEYDSNLRNTLERIEEIEEIEGE